SDRSIEMAVPAVVQAAQTLDGRVARGERRGFLQPLGSLVELLLAQQEQSEIGPRGRFLRHQLQDAFELVPRDHVLARLHRCQRDIERGDRLTIGGLGDCRLAATSAGDYREGEYREERGSAQARIRESASRHADIVLRLRARAGELGSWGAGELDNARGFRLLSSPAPQLPSCLASRSPCVQKDAERSKSLPLPTALRSF